MASIPATNRCDGSHRLRVHVAPDVERASAGWLLSALNSGDVQWTTTPLSDLLAPSDEHHTSGILAINRLSAVEPVREAALPLVVVTRGIPDDLRCIVHWRCTGLVFFGETEYLLRLIRTLREPVRVEVLAAAEKFRDMPILAAALRTLAGRIMPSPAWGSRSVPAIRTIEALAEEVGCSAGYLSRLARSRGVDLALLVDTCLVNTACAWKRYGQALTWERIAWRLGYSSPSSLTELFKRTIRTTPTACGRMSPTTLLDLVKGSIRESLDRSG